METTKLQNLEIEGNVVVARSVATAGNLHIGGDLNVKHDVKIEGWLDAPNLMNPAKGLYATVDELEEVHREPRPGSWALVGETLPATLYVARRGRWHNTGKLTGTPIVAQMSEQPAAQPNDTPECQVDCRGKLDNLDRRLDEVNNSALAAFDWSQAAGILPFDGFNPLRGGPRPTHGVWFIPPGEGEDSDTPGSFLVISSEYGATQEDYNELFADDNGIFPVRRDCLYRCGSTLYAFDGRDLVALTPEPYVASTIDEIKQKIAEGDVDHGRFYCTVDPQTRIVNSLYLP